MVSVPLLWYDGEKNVGDECSPFIVSSLSGLPVSQVRNTDDGHILALGSMLKFANPQSHVWGTGLIHPDHGLGSPARDHVFALRGKLTHTAWRRAKISLNDIPHGDPGILAPALLQIHKCATPKFRLGIVPHYVDFDTPFFQGLWHKEGVVHLDVRLGLEQFLRDMSDCASVVSSSLHGLIFAEAMGIPNTWVMASDSLTGGSFKFHDWFSTTRFPRFRPLPNSASIDDVITDCCLHDSLVDREDLLNAFPRRQARRFAGVDETGDGATPSRPWTRRIAGLLRGGKLH